MLDPSGMPEESKPFTLTLVRKEGQESVELPAAHVRLSGPGREDVLVELGLRPVVVGSSPECELVVEDPYVSRRHCQLSLTARGVAVKDLGSRNGTWVGQVRVVEVVLGPGTKVDLGQLTLNVEARGEPVRVPLAMGTHFGEAVGTSVAMRALFARLQRAAQTDEPVLLLGESGTGKELLARAIHQTSARRGKPFVVFDCGAVAPSLIESELFGYEKGAFSGATGSRVGLLESASGGTLFLDELGELPLDLQPRLLRALENREIRPVGSNQVRKVDLRIVAATHRDLRRRVEAGEFRADLYYRLAVVEARVPPLRERREDIPPLVERLLAQRTPPCKLTDLPANTLEMLMAHAWPGNVRELRNTLARLVLFPAGESLGPLDATVPVRRTEGPAGLPPLPFHEAREAVVADFERRYVDEQLQAHDGNVSAAARAMGVSRQFLHKLITQHGLKDLD